MKVFLSELAELKLLRLSDYLLEEWGLKTRDKFISKLTEKINQVASHPKSCPQSSLQKGLHKCVVTKQTSFFYRILKQSDEIEIITLIDTRQNPNLLSKDIR